MPIQQTHTQDKMNKPLISFIITYYNLPIQMLCECIDSILALSLRPFEREIIIVDDGSDLSPINDLMPYRDEIIYIRQKNGGVSTARNTALQLAKGEYIQIVDGDDCLLQIPYEHCLDLIRYGHHIDVLLFDFTKSKNKSKPTFNDSSIQTGSDFMRTHNIRGAVWCTLFRQAICGKLQFTPGIEYGEDEEFTPQLLLRAEKVMETEAQAYYYRPRNSSAIHQHNDEKKQKRLDDTMEVILHLNKLADTLPHADKIAMQRRIAQLTMDYLYNTIVLTRSRQTLENKLDMLRKEGLFPLIDKDYSKKYVWFRRMINSNIGRSILLHTLPLLKKER